MAIYIISLLGTLFLSNLYEHAKDEKNRKISIIILITFLVFISGFRYMNYYLSDEWNYRTMADAYKGVPFDINLFYGNKEWLFSVLQWVAVNIFGSNQALIFLTALVTNVSIILFLRKYAYSFTFSTFLYISSGAFFTSMNIMRQYMAVAVILWCYPMAKKKKFVKYFLLVIVASFIHQSAWVMLPLYFVFAYDSKRNLSYVLIAAMLVVFVNFDRIVGGVLSHTSYEYYLENITDGGYGTGLIRVLAWLVPYCLIMLYQKKLQERFGASRLFIYCVILCVCILVVSLKYVFVARFEVYFVVPAYAVLGMIPLLFTDRSKKVVWMCMILFFFAFGAYQAYINPVYHNMIFENISGTL